MCLIMYKPKKVQFNWKHFELGFEYNPDGCGFTLVSEGKAYTRKGYMTFDEVKTRLEKIKNLTNCELIVHTRIATSGNVNPINCHPYPISKREGVYSHLCLDGYSVLYHNGI